MERILERHDDVGTVGFIVYSYGDRLYADKARTMPLTSEDFETVFFKGCIVDRTDIGEGFWKPTRFNPKNDDDPALITCCCWQGGQMCEIEYWAVDPEVETEE